MSTYEEYKKYVRIVKVAESLGYELNRKAGKRPLEYKHPEHNTIVISNRAGLERYFTRHESENKGTVIDFVKHRLPLFNVYYSKEAEGINKVLSSFTGSVQTSAGRTRIAEKPGFNLKDFNITKPTFKDLVYLSNERGLKGGTLKAFLSDIQLVKQKNHPITNIGFPYRIPPDDKIVGFELVNFMFKGHARGSNRSSGIWLADLSGTGFPGRVFIGESAIDAMSFYQLFRKKFQLDNAAFISSGGYVTDKQLRNIISKFPNSRIHTIFDNDLSGHLYDIRAACMKANKDLQVFYKQGGFEFNYHNKNKFTLNKDQVSLTRFRKETGIRTQISVHKAKEKDFNEMLLDKSDGQRLTLRR